MPNCWVPCAGSPQAAGGRTTSIRTSRELHTRSLCPITPQTAPQCGILPYAGTDIALFEILNEHLHDRYGGEPPHLAIIGAGMVSSVFAQVRARAPLGARPPTWVAADAALRVLCVALLRRACFAWRCCRLAPTFHAPGVAGVAAAPGRRCGAASAPTLTVRLRTASRRSPPQFVSYPLALVRTRLQAQGVGGNPIKYSGMLDVFSQTMRNEGVRGLYKARGRGAWAEGAVGLDCMSVDGSAGVWCLAPGSASSGAPAAI
jgi:hypothetical protein